MKISFNIPTIIGVMYDPLIFFSPSIYISTTRELFQPICTKVGGETNNLFRFHFLLNRYLSYFTVFPHELMPGSSLPSFFLVPGNTAINPLILGTSSPDGGSVRQYTHLFTLLFDHPSPSDLTHNHFTSHSLLIITFIYYITISYKTSSTGTPTVEIKATNLSVYQAPCMFSFIPCFVRLPINLTGDRFITGTGLYAYMIFFVNRTTII